MLLRRFRRSLRRFNGTETANGTYHIITGAAGNNEGLGKGKGPGHGLTVAANYNATGFGELSQLNATHLRWRYILAATGALYDEVVLEA